MDNLRQLYLTNNKVTDAGLEYLSRCKRLEDLNLQWNDVTDAGIRHLVHITTLEKLDVYSTSVSERGKAELQKKMPKLRFYHPNDGEPR